MTKVKSRNTFASLNRDQLHSLTDQKTYQYALNAVFGNADSKGVFTNEESNEYVAGDDSIVGMHQLDEKNSTLFFKEGDIISIFNHDTGEEEEVFRASEFNCSFDLGGCEWHDIESKVQSVDCQETIIYFSSKCEYYWFNLDVMLNEKRKAGLIKKVTDTECDSCATGCDYFKVFQCGCAPKITTIASQTGGGGLLAGSYRFVARMLDSNGTHTNWFHVSESVSVGSENNIATERSNASITVNLSSLDCRYSQVEIAVIERTGGIINTKTLDTFNYQDRAFSYTYTGLEGTPIDITEVLVKGKTFLQGKYLEQRDGRMFFYGIRPRKNLNYQYLAKQIQTE